MRIVEQIYSGYGQDPVQSFIVAQGNDYLETNYPDLSYITSTALLDSVDRESRTAQGAGLFDVWVVVVAIIGEIPRADTIAKYEACNAFVLGAEWHVSCEALRCNADHNIVLLCFAVASFHCSDGCSF